MHRVIRNHRYNNSQAANEFRRRQQRPPVEVSTGTCYFSVIFAEFLAADPNLPLASPSRRRMTWKRSSLGRARRAWEQERVSSEDDGMEDTEEESWTGGRSVSQAGVGRSCVIIYSTRSMALEIRVSGPNRYSLKSGLTTFKILPIKSCVFRNLLPRTNLFID